VLHQHWVLLRLGRATRLLLPAKPEQPQHGAIGGGGKILAKREARWNEICIDAPSINGV
jgi:hypothetical protein